MNDFSKHFTTTAGDLLTLHSVNRLVIIILMLSAVGVSTAQEHELTPVQYLRKAETYIDNHQWDQALNALDACIVRDPGQAEAFHLRATVREHFNLNEEALTDYNVYLFLRPENTEALFARGQLQMRLGRYQEAKDDFIKLTYLPQTETTTIFFQTDAFTGGTSKIFTTQGAEKAYLFNYIGLAEVQLGNLGSAINWYDSAIRTIQSDPDLYVNRGIAKEKNNNPEEALRDFRRALQIDPSHAIAKQHMGVLAKESFPDSSAALLDAAILDNPNMPYAYAERGFARMQKGMLKEALADYSEAIRLDPEEEEYFLNRGLIREKLNDLNGAYRDYTQAITLKHNFDKAWLNRGNLLARRGKLVEAIEDYTVAITYNAEYSAAFYNRAIARGRLHQDKEACEDLQAAEAFGHEVAAKVKRQICH
jgi:tetratricopeptide (TPR) repeat protein